jgi:TolB protein
MTARGFAHRSTTRMALALGAALALVAGIATIAPTARAEVTVDITQGTVAPLPIAISSFHGASLEGNELGRQIAEVVTNDLQSSGLFAPLPATSFPQQPDALQATPNFPAWQAINAQALVSGAATIAGDGQLSVDFRLWDTFGNEQLAGFSYTTQPDNWRRIAHIVADAIYKRLTGEEGYFDTRVVYIAESGPADNRMKRLAIMDQDGANNRYLTDGSYLVLTPRFSPSTQDITYVAYINNQPRVYLFNIDSGRQEILGNFPGMTFAPRFAPSGQAVLLSIAEGGNSEIYSLSLAGRALSRLTNHPAIDTAPSMSPDGSRIVFESDRSGSQQLYIMSAGGGEAQRISFGDGRYATPVWSPRGDLIAFTKILGGTFYIGVMRPDGSGERLLADGYLVESPSWAPNGRVLMYYVQGPTASSGATSSALYTVDITGTNARRVNTPGDGSDPAWSPLLP